MVKDQYGNEAQFRDGDTFKIYGSPVEVRDGRYLFGDGSEAPVTDYNLQWHKQVGAISEYKSKITFRHGDRYKIFEADRFVGKDLRSYNKHGGVCMGHPYNERDMGDGSQHSYVPADPNKTYDDFGREVSEPSRGMFQDMHRRAQRAESRAIRAERDLARIQEILGVNLGPVASAVVVRSQADQATSSQKLDEHARMREYKVTVLQEHTFLVMAQNEEEAREEFYDRNGGACEFYDLVSCEEVLK